MKTMLMLFALGLLLPGHAGAQITLTMQDEYTFMESTVRERAITYFFDSTFHFPIGGEGTGYVYDLSGHARQWIKDTLVLYHDIDLPLGRHATHAYEYSVVPGWYPAVDYYELIESGLYFLGNLDPDQYHPPLFLDDPPRPEYLYPLTLGSEWMYTEDRVYMFSRFLDSSWSVEYSAHVKAEAAGVLRLPEGDYACLRVRRIHGSGDETRVEQEFLTTEGIRAMLRIDRADSSSTNPRVTEIRIIRYGNAVGVPAPANTARAIDLRQNYPNPFNPRTTITFEIPVAGRVRLSVYDLLGRERAVLVDGMRPAGVHRATFDGTGYSSGSYLFRLEADGVALTRSMTLLK